MVIMDFGKEIGIYWHLKHWLWNQGPKLAGGKLFFLVGLWTDQVVQKLKD